MAIEIGIPVEDRQKITDGLSRLLADSYTLYLQTHNYHGNVTGIEEEDGVPSAEEMIRQLVIGQETVVRTAREVFPLAEKANDEPTADLLTQRMQTHEKNAWMLRSMLGE